jgi:hypothetical protein
MKGITSTNSKADTTLTHGHSTRSMAIGNAKKLLRQRKAAGSLKEDQINEISKKLARNYVTKAVSSAMSHSRTAGRIGAPALDIRNASHVDRINNTIKHYDKADKRQRGIYTAVDKIGGTGLVKVRATEEAINERGMEDYKWTHISGSKGDTYVHSKTGDSFNIGHGKYTHTKANGKVVHHFDDYEALRRHIRSHNEELAADFDELAQLDELSMDALRSYKSKANAQSDKTGVSWNRSRYIARAAIKLARHKDNPYRYRKEEIEEAKKHPKDCSCKVCGSMKEEVVNEISKKALSSYIDTATGLGRTNGVVTQAYNAGLKSKSNRAVSAGHYRTAVKRIKGIRAAADKLTGFARIPATNEEAEQVDEGLRLTATHKNADGSRVAKVYRDAEWDEHRVTFHKNGVHNKNADYHTDDKDDAHRTAKYWVNSTHEEAEQVDEKHIGFKKLKGELAHQKGVHNAGALAAYIGRKKYGKKGFAKLAHEEVEQVDELSKGLLGRYVSKADSDVNPSWVGKHLGDKAYHKARNRDIGVDRATRKIFTPKGTKLYANVAASEEVEHVDEVSNGLLKRYQQAAGVEVGKDRAFKDAVDGRVPTTKKAKRASFMLVAAAKRKAGDKIPELNNILPKVKVHASEEVNTEESGMTIEEGKTYKVDPANIRRSSKAVRDAKKASRNLSKSRSGSAVEEEVEQTDEGRTFRASSDYRAQRDTRNLKKYAKALSRGRDAKRQDVEKKEA